MTTDTPRAPAFASGFWYECGTLPGKASTSPRTRSLRSPAMKIVTWPSRQVKYSRVPGRCGVPRIAPPGAKSITDSIPSGMGSGMSPRNVTPLPRLCEETSDSDHLRTFARGEASSSSIGTPSAPATLRSTARDGLPTPDSRLAIVERGKPEDLASAPCVRVRTWRSAARLRARSVATCSVLSIVLTFRQSVGHSVGKAGFDLYYWLNERRPHMTRTLQNDSRGRFAGLRVAVTGGTSGLGLALVRELLGRGAHVAFVARNREGVERVAGEHGRAHGIVGDVSKKEDIHPIAMQIVGSLGGLDVLVNNASALGPTPLALLGDTDCEDFERALATNVLGPFRLTKALLGALAASARGV